MSFGESLTKIRKSRGVSRKDFAEQLNIPYTTLRNYETDQREPGHKLLIRMASLLSVSVDELIENHLTTKIAPPYSDEAMQMAKDYDSLDGHGQRVVRLVADEELARCVEEDKAKQARAAAVREQKNQMETGEEIAPEGDKIIELPFDELKASAGTGYELDYDRLIPWKVIYNEMTRKADFCLEVDGRSMEPMIHDGDIILVRQQPSVDIGEIGLFTVGDKGFVKKQGEDRLISINNAFKDIFPGEYDVFFCRGKVIGVLDPTWIVEK